MQLPPVRAIPLYAEKKCDWLNLDSLWKHFIIAELTDVMRQLGDAKYIDLPNHIRVA